MPTQSSSAFEGVEQNNHAFIVRVWRESREIEGALPEWRGMIQHVRSGHRRYIRDLAALIDFIQPYLLEMGVRIGQHSRFRRWLLRWRPAGEPDALAKHAQDDAE